jgi:quercetin dioxygenase-like cupin family protein
VYPEAILASLPAASTSPTSTSPTSAKTVQHRSLEQIPVEHLNPLLERQIVSGEKGMVSRLLLRKGCLVPLHHHENEQITWIIEGALRFMLDESGCGGGDAPKERIVRAGELLVIPGNVPHSAEALEDTIDVDFFSPPRADWLAGTDAYLRR